MAWLGGLVAVLVSVGLMWQALQQRRVNSAKLPAPLGVAATPPAAGTEAREVTLEEQRALEEILRSKSADR